MSDSPIVGAPSIDKLQEIALPEPVSWMPQTIGWLVLLIVLLIALVLFGWYQWRRWQANQYRREALAEFTDIESLLHQHEANSEALARLPVLVKRTVLSFAQRPQVASLSGEQWLLYLDQTLPGKQFSSGPGRLLWRLAYAPAPALNAIPQNEINALCTLLRRWIQQHAAV